MSLDIERIRSQFPALKNNAIYFDNPGGTQVSKFTLERMNAYLTNSNANHGGAFQTSRDSDSIIMQARIAVADFLNADSPNEIVFGPNMTSLTFNISRSLANWINPGDRVVVTRLDHDANIAPWTIIAKERGCHIDWVDFDTENGTLKLDNLQEALKHKPRIVAVGYASNALGTINPVKKIIKMAHDAGALVYIDAVQYAPHGAIDVQDLKCDFLVCSAYKFFGPHVGMLYGRYDLLDNLPAYKVRPASPEPPGKFETGTGNFEGYAGVLGAIEYLEWIGKTFGRQYSEKYRNRYQGRRLLLKQALAAIHAYEYELSRTLLDILEETPGVRLYGLTDQRRLEERVPTVSFTLQGWNPRQVAEELDKAGIYVWDGNYYALAVTERLGVEKSGGMVRIGPVHYNTTDEIEKFGEVLRKMIRYRNF